MKYNGPPRYDAPIDYNEPDVAEGPQHGWFGNWFANGWFPSVWFAPGDESDVPPEELHPALEAPVVRTQAQAGGYYDTGKAWIKKDHGWVKATKATKYGVSNRWVGETSGVIKVLGSVDRYAVTTGEAAPAVSNQVSAEGTAFNVRHLIGETASRALAEMETQRLKAATPCGTTATLGMDEILALLEMMDN